MARSAEPGRTALLDAGRRLLSDRAGRPLGRLSVNAIVAEASMSKGAFFQHFPTRRDYVVKLHGEFHDDLGQRLVAAVAGMEPGRDRLERGIATFLNSCLDLTLTKAFFFQARADIDLSDAVARQNLRFAGLVAVDLALVGWRDSEAVARLLVAAVADVAMSEAATGRPEDRLRRALLDVWAPGDPRVEPGA